MQESLVPDSYPIDSNLQTQREMEPRLRFFALRLFWVFCWCVVGLFIFMTGSSALHGWSVYQSGTALQVLAERSLHGGDLGSGDLGEIQQHLEEATAGLSGLSNDMWFWQPLLRRLAWVPEYGPTLAVAPELVEMGKHLGMAASDVVALGSPMLDSDQSLSTSLQNVSVLDAAARFAEQDVLLERVADNVDLAAMQVAALELDGLHPQLLDPLYLAQQMLPVAGPGLRSLPHLDGFIGREKAQTFLILVQNNDELRATGGFISAFGRLVVDKGELAELKFSDSYWVRREGVEYAGAPKPMQQYMGTQLMMFRDANWSPDFPTTAQTIKGIFRQDTGIDVDGVITVDMNALRLLTDALAPLTVAGLDEVLTGDTVVAEIKRIWDRPPTGDEEAFNEWWFERKAFIPTLADAILTRALDGDVNYVDLALVSLQALEERAVQVWIDQPQIAAELATLKWDGTVSAPKNADFIALVDSNLGYNKVDGVIGRAIDYAVDWRMGEKGAATGAVAALTVTYHHPLEVTGHRCDITPRYGASYDDMAARCYFNYVRLYVPSGSELIGMDGVLEGSASSKRGEGGTQVFSGYFVLPPGEEQRVTFTYHLPDWIKQPAAEVDYPIVIQRQAGTKPLPIVLGVFGREHSTTIHDGVQHLSLH